MKIIVALLMCAQLALPISVYHADGTTTTYTDTAVHMSDAITAAIDGDIIECTSGFNYVYSLNTGSRLTDHGSGWVIIRPSSYRLLPDGNTRVSASDISDLCQLSATSGFTNPVLDAAVGAHNWTVSGLYVTGVSGVPFSALMASYPFTAPSTFVGDMAYNLVFDHIYATGTYNSQGPCRGMWLNSQATVVKNSIFDEFKAIGQDCQAITSAGNIGVTMRNNALAGAGMSWQAGGTTPLFIGQTAELNDWRGNRFFKHTHWKIQIKTTDVTADPRYPNCLYYDGEGEVYNNSSTGDTWQCNAGGTWDAVVFVPCTSGGLNCYNDVKNLLEYKFSLAINTEANLFENAWAANQDNMVIWNSVDQQGSSSRAPDQYRLRYNIIRGGHSALAFGIIQQFHSMDPLRNVRVEHNVFDQIGSWLRTSGGSGSSSYWNMAGLSDPGGVSFRHNTVVNSPFPVGHGQIALMYFSSNTHPNFPGLQILDNAAQYTSIGIIGDGGPNQQDLYASTGSFNWAAGGWSRNNVLPLDGSGVPAGYQAAYNQAPCCGSGASAGGTQYLPALGTTVWTNPVTGGNFHINPAGVGCGGFPCTGKASDASDPGADIDTVSAFTAHAKDGLPNPALNFRLGSTLPASTAADVYFTAPDARACSMVASLNETLSPAAGSIAFTRSGVSAKAAVTGLSAGTQYWYVVGCPALDSNGASVTMRLRGQFRTRL